MSSPPIYEPEKNPEYTIEFLVESTGLPSKTILYYQEQGLVRSRDGNYDEEALLTLRRIEHLREAFDINTSGLKMILGLMLEVERLRAQVRARG